jgi:predicted PurR-regulated permease PerM
MQSNVTYNGGPSFAKRVLIVLALATAVVVGLAAIRYLSDLLLLIFGGILLAILVRGLALLVHRGTGWNMTWSLAAAGAALLLVLGAGSYFIASQVADEFGKLEQSLQSAWQNAQSRLSHTTWGSRLVESADAPSQGQNVSHWFRRASGAFFAIFGVLGSLLVLVFLAVYFAIDPALYRSGLLRLLPKRRRGRGGEVLDALGRSLQRWLLGRLTTMTFVGITTAIGLWALGVPLVLPLSILAFLFDFVPYVGPILAGIPAVLIALTVDSGATTALYVAIFYLAIQFAESYVIQPLIQKHAVNMPPALLISMQVAFSVLLGTIGAVLAAPLTVVLLVAVKMLYCEDVLGDHSIRPASEAGRPENESGASPDVDGPQPKPEFAASAGDPSAKQT